MLSSSGGAPHHLGLRVNVIRFAPRSRLEMMNGPADGPGPLSCARLNASGVAVDALRQQHGAAREHALPVGPGLGEGDDRLAIVDSAFDLLDAVAAVGGRDRESLVLAAGGVDLGLEVLPGDRGAVAPYRLGVDGVGDDLRVGAGQLDAGEVVGVDRGRAVGGDPERARHGGPHRASRRRRCCRRCASELKFGGKSFSASRRLPPCCRLATSCGLMSLVRADLCGSARRRRFLVAAGAGGQGQRGDHRCRGEASDLHADRL